MKRALSLLLCLVLTLSCISVAFADEDFSLRSGIHFGDTIDEIVSKETTLTRESETSDRFKGKVAGYDGVECLFAFDVDGKLKSMDYHFSGDVCGSRDNMNEIYKKIYQSLKRQYGSPLGNVGGSCNLITGPAFLTMGVWVYLMGTLDGCSGDYTDYDEWIVDCDGYHVKIDMVSYYYRNSSYDYKYMVDVSYYQYTDEDYDDAVREKKGEQEEVDNDF